MGAVKIRPMHIPVRSKTGSRTVNAAAIDIDIDIEAAIHSRPIARSLEEQVGADAHVPSDDCYRCAKLQALLDQARLERPFLLLARRFANPHSTLHTAHCFLLVRTVS